MIIIMINNHHHHHHKNCNFLDCGWLKIFYFFTNSLAKLLSGSLLLDSLSDSLISQSHSKLYFKSTKHIQSCSWACLLFCFLRLIRELKYVRFRDADGNRKRAFLVPEPYCLLISNGEKILSNVVEWEQVKSEIAHFRLPSARVIERRGGLAMFTSLLSVYFMQIFYFF